MTQKEFSQETLNQAVDAIKNHESDIQAMREKCKEMPLEEVAQTILVEKFDIAQIEAAEIVEDINKGIEDFDSQFHMNSTHERVIVQEKLADLTKNMSDEERISSYVGILTALQLFGKSDVTKEEIDQLNETNSKKDIETMATEIETLLNDGIDLQKVADVINEKGVNVEVITELAKQIEMNKDDYKFMTALWLYIAQREGSIKLFDSEVPIPAQMIGALSSASIETILATAELKEGKIEQKRWQVVMKWILGALLGVGLIYLIFNAYLLATVSVCIALDLMGAGLIASFITMVVVVFITGYLAEKLLEWIPELFEFLGDVYDTIIVPLTNKVKGLISKIMQWFKSVLSVIASDDTEDDDNRGGTNPARLPQPTTNNPNHESIMQPAMA